jgi:hypothetical protein
MKLTASLSDRAPFLLMGVLCWLCGAVFVGLGAALLVNTLVGFAAAVAVTTGVLALFWRLGDAVHIRTDIGGRK